jgi:hypothetical protein
MSVLNQFKVRWPKEICRFEKKQVCKTRIKRKCCSCGAYFSVKKRQSKYCFDCQKNIGKLKLVPIDTMNLKTAQGVST